MVGVLRMNAQQLDDWADRKSESGVLKLVARWGMTASIPVMLAAMTWVGSTLWHMNSEQAKLAGRIDVLVERIGTSVIRTTDIELGFKLRDQRIDFLEKSVGDHGLRIYKLEQR